MLLIYIAIVARVSAPVVPASDLSGKEVTETDTGLYKLQNNWFRKSDNGFYELYVQGNAFDCGVAYGQLTKELLYSQELAFTGQIERMIPSKSWLNTMKVFVGWFNRDLENYIPLENKQEIYGVSLSASPDFNYISGAYQRMLNYHAAHDIGHALQNLSLVGCTSFATWGDASEDSLLIIGRNFDFYMGDEFAKDKIIAFYHPDQGHSFAMITFAGMTGVLSGMNTAGLTVTLNAAKSEIPSGSATPVSILARQILQYASTIDEAFAIANTYKTFVSESFLIGSARDGKAAVIEKTPEVCTIYHGQKNSIICANHFQSDSLKDTEVNKKHIETSASAYRYERVEELLHQNGKNNVGKTVDILRDKQGLGGVEIGLGNEKSICQLIAHHSIIFVPAKKQFWIAAAPYQLGAFYCYDLDSVFSKQTKLNEEIYSEDRTIPKDYFSETKAFIDFQKFNRYRFPFSSKEGMNPDSIVAWNPECYLSHMITADYYYEHKEYKKAEEACRNALTKEIATEQEREHIEKLLIECVHQ
ncbi:MAG: peptidase C45 [Crocinitomicaceae bacterium]|nr:peptidase C45 [Crocinitomicaceae bacterium]